MSKMRSKPRKVRSWLAPIQYQVMRIITPAIESYFASLQSRLGEAEPVSFRAVSIAKWLPQPSQCHENVDYWIAGRHNCTRVRGWLTWGEDELGSCLFIAHSVVDDNGILYDITPIDPNTSPLMFLKHIGTVEAFDAMQPQFSSATYPFLFELPQESCELEEDAGYN